MRVDFGACQRGSPAELWRLQYEFSGLGQELARSAPALPGALPRALAGSGGASHATTSPRRLMFTGSPPASIRRMRSRHFARKRVTDMAFRDRV
jgi:hypothetical protein